MKGEELLFIGFIGAMFVAAVAITRRYLGSRHAIAVALGLLVWFVYVELLAHSGVLENAELRPPGMAYILGPVVVYLLLAVVSAFSKQARWPLAFPLWLIIGTQSFRVVVELFIHRLWLDGTVPQTLTYNGANVDIYIGASAPLIAFLSTRAGWGKVALAWNLLGLIALANVISRAIMTAPGPLNWIHTTPPNRMFGTFPFTFIPAFFVPLALTLHVVAIRILVVRLRTPRIGG